MTLFQEWQEQHKNDEPRYPERLRVMHNMHGRKAGEMCGTCIHIEKVGHYRHHFLKCKLTVITRGPGTDWRYHWPACGLWTPWIQEVDDD